MGGFPALVSAVTRRCRPGSTSHAAAPPCGCRPGRSHHGQRARNTRPAHPDRGHPADHRPRHPRLASPRRAHRAPPRVSDRGRTAWPGSVHVAAGQTVPPRSRSRSASAAWPTVLAEHFSGGGQDSCRQATPMRNASSTSWVLRRARSRWLTTSRADGLILIFCGAIRSAFKMASSARSASAR